MDSSSQNILQIIYNKKNDIGLRLSKAKEALENSSLQPEFILKWISNVIAFDQNFQVNGDAWSLFLRCVEMSPSDGAPFLITMRPDIAILNAFKSDIRDIALNALEKMQERFPNAWRPKINDLIITLKNLLSLEEIYKNQISFLISTISNHRELSVASDSIFQKIVELFDPLIDNAEKLDIDQVLSFLSKSLCGPYLFQKISGKDLGNTFDGFISKLVEPNNQQDDENSGLSIRKNVVLFMHKFLKTYSESANLISNKFAFPLNLYKKTTNLDLMVPIINESRILKLYTPQKEDTDEFKQLNIITEQAIKENHQRCLAELTRLDFRLVRPTLSILLETADENFAVACLEMAFELRMPQVLFGQNELPDDSWSGETSHIETRLDKHIVDFPVFVEKYTDLVSTLNFEQINGLLKILASAKEDSDQAMLFWTVKNAKFTEIHIPVVEYILKTSGTNPWRCAAASIACKQLRLNSEPVVTDEMLQSHPIILYTLLSQPRFGRAETVDEIEILHWKKVSRTVIVPRVPTPSMESTSAYRLAFIIEHLPELTHCFHDDSLTSIVRYILTRCSAADSLNNPKTIADYSLRLLYNTNFYESQRIKHAFHSACLSLLLSEETERNNKNVLAMIISSMPVEFIQTPEDFLPSDEEKASFDYSTNDVPLVVYNILIKSYGQAPDFEIGDLFKEAAQQIPQMILNLAQSLPVDYVKSNIDELYSTAPNDIISQLLPLLLYRSQTYITDLSHLTKEAILGLCEYAVQTEQQLPYKELLMKDDLDCVCAEAKAGLLEAQSYLLNALMFNYKNAPKVMDALSYVSGIDKLCKSLKKKIGMLMRSLTDKPKQGDSDIVEDNEEEIENDHDQQTMFYITKLPPLNDIVKNFAHVLPQIKSEYYDVTNPDYVLELLKFATNELQISIFGGIIADASSYESYEETIKQLINSNLTPKQLIQFTSIRMTRFYSDDIIERIFYLVVEYLNDCTTLDDVCIIARIVTNVYINSRRASKIPVLAVESVRHVSSVYFRFMQQQQSLEPSFKQLKALSKLYSAASRNLRSDFQHYFIASFVSNICSVNQLSHWSSTKQKMLQNCIFPVFQKVEKDQLAEISIALHETHRQQFQILYQRWQKEAQYTGKV